MASPQKENGYTAIANELLEQILKAPLNSSDFRIFLTIIRKTYGYNKKEDHISLTQFEKYTGLSRPTVVKSLKRLVNWCLLVKSENKYKVQKDWEKWVVNSYLLVNSKITSSKPLLTENGKPLLTHKRQKTIIQKKEILNKLRQKLIKDKTINH